MVFCHSLFLSDRTMRIEPTIWERTKPKTTGADMKKWADFFRICPQFSQNEAIQEFKCQNTKKRALASMEKPCTFLASETQKTQEKPGFLGVASFLTASSGDPSGTRLHFCLRQK